MAAGPNTSRAHNGFVWGCALPILGIFLIVTGWFVYHTYYFTQGYKQGPGLPTVMRAVNKSPRALGMLGQNIEILTMELNMPSNARQNGHRIFYKVHVRGSKAEGEIQTSVLIAKNGATTITSLKLIGPDEIPRNLLQESAPPP